jgi:hypothetical protein
MLDEICRKKFPYLYFRLDIIGNQVQVTGDAQYEMQQVLTFAKKALVVIGQKFLAAEVARQIKLRDCITAVSAVTSIVSGASNPHRCHVRTVVATLSIVVNPILVIPGIGMRSRFAACG